MCHLNYGVVQVLCCFVQCCCVCVSRQGLGRFVQCYCDWLLRGTVAKICSFVTVPIVLTPHRVVLVVC